MRRLIPALLATSLLAAAAHAEEGMWTFDNFPIAQANRDLGHKDRPGVARQGAARVGADRRGVRRAGEPARG
jgi:hypothetical protein